MQRHTPTSVWCSFHHFLVGMWWVDPSQQPSTHQLLTQSPSPREMGKRIGRPKLRKNLSVKIKTVGVLNIPPARLLPPSTHPQDLQDYTQANEFGSCRWSLRCGHLSDALQLYNPLFTVQSFLQIPLLIAVLVMSLFRSGQTKRMH